MRTGNFRFLNAGSPRASKSTWRLRAVLLIPALSILPLPTQGAPPPTAAVTSPAGDSGVVYHLLGFSLRGTKRVDTDALVATLPQHEGDKITQADIKADTDRLAAALKARHVHGELTNFLLQREGGGHKVWVMWNIQLIDALANAPGLGPYHLESQSFSGNTKLSDAQLAAATGLHLGDTVRQGGLSDARTGIEQAYDSVLHGASAVALAKVRIKKDKDILVNWQITEPQ